MRKSLNCFNRRGNRLYKAKNKLSIFVYRATFVTVLLSLMFPVGLASSQMREVEGRVSNRLVAQKQTHQQRRKEAIRLSEEGLKLLNQAKYKEALKLYEEALLIFREIGDKPFEGLSLYHIGIVYFYFGEFQKSLDNYEQGLTIAQQTGDTVVEVLNINGIGGVYDKLGKYQKSLENYQKSLKIAKNNNYKSAESVALNNIADIYRRFGKYQEALELYQQSLTALRLYQQSLTIAKEAGSQKGEATIFMNIGSLYGNQGKHKEALNSYEQALKIAKKIGNSMIEGRVFNLMAEVYSVLGEDQKALDNYKKSLIITQKNGDKVNELYNLSGIARVYTIQKNYPKAFANYQQALVISQGIGEKLLEGIVLSNFAMYYIYQSQYNQSEKPLFSAIEIWEELRAKLTDDQKISLFERQADAYQLLQKALIAQNKIEQALEISERGRARAFIDLLTLKLNKNQKYINTTPSIDQIKKIAKHQKTTLIEYSLFSDSELYIWVIKPTGEITFKQVDLKSLKTPLKNLVETSRQSIGVIKQRGAKLENAPLPNPETQKRYLQQLHELLITPIANHLPKNPSDRVIFIPHESLFLVPFPALKDANNKYLIEKHTILTAPAIQVLDYTRKNTETLNIASLQPGDTLLVGNPIMPITGIPPVQQRPLPGTEKEANKIAPILNTQPLIGKQATKSAVLQKISTAKIIHLATHGLLYGFGERIPGAIALAPDTPGVNEGLLKTTEIINLNLNADLVVLSACDTGGGEITGDGVVGLSRSLLTAGAESVIVSLWAVDDSSTSDLMVEFYRQLQQNPDKAKALRQAMLSTMKKYPHPIHWAAFTLIGNAE
jgi:CHAT domain-containing protein/Tfp pilus assembly protein PilF